MKGWVKATAGMEDISFECRRWQDTFEAARQSGQEVALVLTDPPYGTTCNAWDTSVGERGFVGECFRLLPERGVLVSTSAEPFTSKVVAAMGKDFRYCWYWNKRLGTNFLNAKKQPLRVIEPIVVGYRRQARYNPQMKDSPRGERTWSRKKCGSTESYGRYTEEVTYSSGGKSHPTTLLEFYQAPRGKLHPTQKPVELFRYLIETYTQEGDLVVDPFLGSGTTAVACKLCGRRFIGGDLSENYIEVARKRMQEFL